MKKLLIIVFLVFTSIIFWGCGSPKADDVIGEVNGDPINRLEYDQQYNIIKFNYESQQSASLDEKANKDVIEQLKEQAFNDLVLQSILHQEADKREIKISKEEIDNDLDYIKESQTQDNKDGYKQFLEKLELNEQQLRKQIETQQIYWKLYNEVTSDVKVGEDEAEKYYNDNPDSFKEPGGIEISHILVSDESQAKDILTRINKGENFAKLAGEYSTCPSKDNGGDLGIINESTEFAEEFKDAALKLKPGEITEQPIKTDFGYHIIKAGEKKEEKTKTFDEAKDEIVLGLQQEKEYQVFNDYLENLHKDAKIKDNRKK